MGAKAPILHSTTSHQGSREPRPSPPGSEKRKPFAPVTKIKGPSSPATRLQDHRGRKPSRLSTKSRVRAAPHLGPSSPALGLQDAQGRQPSRLSTKSRAQAAPRLAPGRPIARNPRPCRRNQGPRTPEPHHNYSPSSETLAPVDEIKGPGRPAPRPRAHNCEKPSALSTKSRAPDPGTWPPLFPRLQNPAAKSLPRHE